MTTWPDHRGRAARALARVDAPALVVHSPANVRYLTGFTGSNGSVLVAAGELVLVTDGRYVDQAAQECPQASVVVGRDTLRGAVAHAREHHGARVALEAEHVSLAAYDRLAAAFPGTELVPTTDVVESLRRCKDGGERDLIARACATIGEAVEAVAADVRPGLTERRVARRLEELLVELGADGDAFPSIVAGGPNSAIPHHQPTDRELHPGDLLKIDAGALVRGYCSDLTRMFVVGAEPTPEQRDLHEAVAASAAAARDLLAPGVSAADLDAAARAALAAAGLADRFTHGLGHGVGLEIHEAPMLSAAAPVTIEVGDVLTIEPGAYLPGFGGVRIEDTLAVTDTTVDCLTPVTRELRRVG